MTFLDRLKIENAELEVNRVALGTFIYAEKDNEFKDLPPDLQVMMKLQYFTMVEYGGLLYRQIKWHKDNA